MKFLADESFPREAVEALRADGYDVAAIGEDSAGIQDEDVLARARREERVLLALDKDFGDLVFKHGFSASCGVILFRVETQSSFEFREIALAALRSREDWSGVFSVITRDRIRMRPLPS